MAQGRQKSEERIALDKVTDKLTVVDFDEATIEEVVALVLKKAKLGEEHAGKAQQSVQAKRKALGLVQERGSRGSKGAAEEVELDNREAIALIKEMGGLKKFKSSVEIASEIVEKFGSVSCAENWIETVEDLVAAVKEAA